MTQHLNFFINGEWIEPIKSQPQDVINPATEQAFAQISMGSSDDIDHAVAAARQAFGCYSMFSVDERLELLDQVIAVYEKRSEDIAQAISMEMGAPINMSRRSQTVLGLRLIQTTRAELANFEFEKITKKMILRYEPIGVCGLITPWNWPMNQVCSKVAPALAAGCTMILKPSEIAPINSIIFAQVLEEAGVPAGVFNLINGAGNVVGEAMSAHPDIDMMSFTGSTRGGIAVAKASANSVKRVTQELGGKSANIILKDTDLNKAVTNGVNYVMDNSGQSCNAPTRMLVPQESMDQAIKAACEAANNIKPGDPRNEDTQIGPVVSQLQYEKIQTLIQVGIDEGATLVAGGTGRPDDLATGYYVKPTVFANVNNDMRIAREEIFGPVLCILGYKDEKDAISIANDSDYGLAAYVCSDDMDHARRVALQIRAGQVAINYRGGNAKTPFGGYKKSGNGREKGVWGLMEFLELKAITGFTAS